MQEQEDQDLQSASPTPVPESEPELVVPSPIENGMDEPPEPRPWLRKVLLWAVGLVVVFSAGVLLSWTLQVRPQAARIESLETQFLASQDQIKLLDEELQSLRPLSGQITQLREELSSAEAHLDLLNVLVDVTTAQLALAQEDDIAARAALTGTSSRLDALESTLEGSNAKDVGDMNARLQLVVEEVQNDPFAARRDLEILTNSLLALERVLFGE